MTQFKIDEVIRRLDRKCSGLGKQSKFARQIGTSPGYICQVRKQGKKPGPKILRALGIRKISVLGWYEDCICQAYPACGCKGACQQIPLPLE